MRRIILQTLAATTLVAIIATVPAALAADLSSVQQRIRDKRAEMESKQEEIRAVIQTRQAGLQEETGIVESPLCVPLDLPDAALSGYIRVFESQLGMFQDLRERLAEVVRRFSDRGIDTAVLETTIQELDQKIETLAADLKELDPQLLDEYAGECSTVEGTGSAAHMQDQLRSDAADVRDFFRGTLRSRLLDLREQVQGESTSERVSDSTSRSHVTTRTTLNGVTTTTETRSTTVDGVTTTEAETTTSP